MVKQEALPHERIPLDIWFLIRRYLKVQPIIIGLAVECLPSIYLSFTNTPFWTCELKRVITQKTNLNTEKSVLYLSPCSHIQADKKCI
jgi:hypothetical protein